MDADLRRHNRTPPKKLVTNPGEIYEERDAYEIDLTDMDGPFDDNPIRLSKWKAKPDTSIDLSNDKPRQGVEERKFDRGMLKETIAGIVAIAFSLLFLWAGYPALILPLLGMIAAYYFGSKSR
jgi:hypothetical protein